MENYILKPINEEELEKQLKEAAEKLEELEKKKIRYIDEKQSGFSSFLVKYLRRDMNITVSVFNFIREAVTLGRQ